MGPNGKVVLVGGGPGAVDLLTVRAVRELEAADVVVADRLGPRDELGVLNLRADIIDVGKSPHHHPIPQDEINEILVREARAGRRVVRLKGGDPYLLGRGGEEYLFCRAHGIDVDVVPGVTSALSVPMAGGIPVTHRGVSAGVLVLSGHGALEFEALAAWPHTIVVLMGMARLGELAAGLIAHGRPASTPIGVVQSGWTPQQRVVKGTLSDVSRLCAEQGIGNPSVIVVGDVVGTLPDAEITQMTAAAQGGADA